MRFTISAVCLSLALSWAPIATAGEYHRKEELKCSQCHTMHASRQHELRSGVVDSSYPLASQTPHEKLLIAATINETCLACHDAQNRYPDVFGADQNARWDRSAGALNGIAGTHSVGTSGPNTQGGPVAYAGWMGHTLGATSAPPGFSGTWDLTGGDNAGLNCADCHAIHGGPGYRNLGSRSARMGVVFDATTSPSYTITVTAAVQYSVDVTVSGTTVSVENTMSTKGVKFSASAGGRMNTFCAACHGSFHGAANTVDGAGAYIRHPTSGVARAITSLVTSYSNLDGTTFSGGADTWLVRPNYLADGVNFEAACLSCHKAHGNARGYGLLYPANDGNASILDYEQGDAPIVDAGTGDAYPAIRNLCITCHEEGR